MQIYLRVQSERENTNAFAVKNAVDWMMPKKVFLSSLKDGIFPRINKASWNTQNKYISKKWDIQD